MTEHSQGQKQGYGQGHKQQPVAIVGMAVLLPGAADLEAYWRNLASGSDAITEVPEGRWDAAYYRPEANGRAPGAAARADRIYCRRGGFVDDLAEVEVTRFGIMPNSVAGTEPDQLIALSVAAQALADAGGDERLPDRDRVGVVLGRGGYLTPGLVRLDQRVRTAHQLTRTLGELMPDLGEAELERVREAFADRLGPESPESAIGLVPNLAASRVASRLDLRGPAYTVDAACASSLIAVDQAVGELTAGRCDVMLAGGVHHCHDVTLWSVFSQLGALSPSQRSRPFHAGADGILIGEGTGVVVLKRLTDAERDGDRVYAVVRGTGVAGDGRAAGLVNPDPGGQARAVRQAWRAAGLDPRAPDAVGLLEAHGTGTPAGDRAELDTLAEVFGPAPAEGGAGTAPVIGSVKSMIGHTMPAAGVAGLVKAALAVHRGTLLPTLHCDEPHPALARTRFRPLTAATPWEAPVRRAAVNAFGFGGINAHVVLEQAPGQRASSAPPAPAPVAATADVGEPEPVLRLGAATPQRLAERLDADDAALLAAAHGPYEGGGGGVRLGIVAPTAKRLALARRVVGKGRAWRGRNDVWFSPEPLLAGEDAGKVAFVFPGLEAEFEPRIDDVARHFGLPVPGRGHAPADGGSELVGDVGRHGVGVVAVGRVLDGALRRMGVAPDAVAGHSVGEWAAMVAGGIYSDAAADDFLASFDPDSLRVPGLAFAAVGASAERVREALTEHDAAGRIVLSHDNAPQQSMVCGPAGAVEDLVKRLRAQRVLGQVLPFQSGFHTPMLAPYLGPLKDGAARFEVHTPDVPVWSGTTAAPYPASAAEVRELFVRHLLEPVRFRPLIEAMHAAGFRAFVQVGTGQLGSLIDDTLHGHDHLTVAANSPHRAGLAQLRRVATALWVEGHAGVTARELPGAAASQEERRPARTAAGRGRAPVRLDLGGALVSLDTAERDALRKELAAGRGTAPAPDAGRDAGAGLEALADRFPVAAELGALLRETADTAGALIAAGGTAAQAGQQAPAARTAAAPRTPAGPQRARHEPGTGPDPDPEPAAEHRTLLRVSTDEMPYLLDHCFFPQPPDWPDQADRRPVVPATTVVRHMMDAAERTAPGRSAVAVHGVRLEQWVDAASPVEIPVTVGPGAPGEQGRAAVSFGQYARAAVELAEHYPAPPPAPWSLDPAAERPCAHAAAQLYRDRWMFHGPLFQGVTALTGIGDRHVRGVITAPPAPGSLLDNVGQILGYWIMATRTERVVVFPVQMRQFRFFGPDPAPGTELDCHIRITSLTDTVLEADVQLTSGGTVWAEITGWQDRRFTGADARLSGGYPEHRGLARQQPGGWCLIQDEWRDLASRDLLMRRNLGSAERDEYDSRPPLGRRQWLLGRIAAKDAVRQWMWSRGEGAVFPAEIRVRNDAAGRPYVTGLHGRVLPELDLSLAHRADAAVAIVRPRDGRADEGAGVGIDIEEITERGEETVAAALGADERGLLAARCAEDGASQTLWFTRFWAAKEAAAKAEGTGLGGRPRDFAVVEAEPHRLLVTAGQRTHQVRCEQVTSDPPGSPSRRYVVAWTDHGTAPGHHVPTYTEETSP